MRNLVSLIVPVYNGEKYIDAFLECIGRQTYKNLEVIFVDDGSKDNTLEKLKNKEKYYEQVHVYSKVNGGPSSARNVGVLKSTGDYVAYADIDDYLYPDYIKYMYELLIEYNADIAFCSYIKIKHTEKVKEKKHKSKELIFSREEAIKFFSYRKYLTGYSCLKLFKKEIVKDINFDESIVFGEDYIYTYEILKKCNKIVYGNKIQYLYMQYGDSSTHKKRDNTLKYRASWLKHLEIMEDIKKNYPSAYKGVIAKCYILAINNTTRIYDKVRDAEFEKELYEFIKNNAIVVASDKLAKNSNRILGFLGMISPKILCLFCKFILSSDMQFLFRRTI